MTTKPKCQHKAQRKMDWAAQYLHDERRMKRGDRQRQCPLCHLWIWDSLWNPPPKPHRNLLASGSRHNEYH